MIHRIIKQSWLLGCVLACMACGTEQPKEIHLTPAPLELNVTNGLFTFSSGMKISVENENQAQIARLFTHLLHRASGMEMAVVENEDKAAVRMQTDNTLSREGEYTLEVTPKEILIKASSDAGFYYALQSLRLSLPAAIEGKNGENVEWTVPAMTIKDAPRFEYRGLMLDVARYFMPLDDVKQLIDCMSMLKLNKLHIHFTDDTGWRIEIKKYPKLTEVGAWRVDRGNIPFYDRRNQQEGEKATLGGFYTQEEIKEMVKYAEERQVEIIPEIDVPAHSCAALAAYPELACPNVKKKITVLPGLGGKDTEIIYCAGNEKTFQFLNDVIDEVAELFPSKYIHMGGDEANKFYWKSCPLCRKRMQQEGITHVEDLQGYFMNRVSEHIREKGKIMMGWDELTNSKIPEGTVIFGWQGLGNAALKAAEQGHKFVLTPARLLYLIRYQGPQWFEPLTYFGNNIMKDIYMYEPVQEGWKKEYEDLLMGVQASMWTEFCNSSNDVMHQVFPRLVALAEVGWAAKGHKDWDEYQKSLDNYLAHLDVKQVTYAKAMYNIQHKAIHMGNGVSVHLNSERTDVEIRYTLDGSDPKPDSELYVDSLFVTEKVVLKVATFRDGKQMGETLLLDLVFNKATGKKITGSNKDELLLTNGVRGSKRQSDFEWCTWTNPVSTFTVDLQKKEAIHTVSLGCLTNYGMGAHKPRSIKVEGSDDNQTFVELGTRRFSDSEIFKEGNFVEDVTFDMNAEVRYIRVSVEAAGNIPESHYMRPSQISKFYIDELMVE